MQFDPKNVAFGRHATFPLRFGWITKGYQALKQDKNLFSSDEATVTLGVGKNMVDSIRYWIQATKIVEISQDCYGPTDIGKIIFEEDGFDPYLEDEGTIWLLHWHLASSPNMGTTFYWFFNRFHKAEFTNQECTDAFLQFTQDNIQQKTSINTLKQDVRLLLRMYVQSAVNSKAPIEEALDSPLSTLKLINQPPENRTYDSKQRERNELPAEIVGFAVSQLFDFFQITELTIDQLMYGTDELPAIGSVFRLTENALIAKLENLINLLPGRFELRETAGIHQLYLLEKIEPRECLDIYYGTVLSQENYVST